jgi:SPP1 family predicted phage head-tail adaptor
MRTMNIGKLNKRITFLKLDDIPDGLGQMTKGFVEQKTVWGSLYPVRGVEFYELQKIQSKVSHKCYVRYLDGITSNDYLKCRGKVYAIESAIDVDLEHKMLEIYCYEHTNKEVIGYRTDSNNGDNGGRGADEAV